MGFDESPDDTPIQFGSGVAIVPRGEILYRYVPPEPEPELIIPISGKPPRPAPPSILKPLDVPVKPSTPAPAVPKG